MDAVDPPLPAAGVEEEPKVHGLVTDLGEVDPDDLRLSGSTARVEEQVRGRGAIAQGVLIHQLCEGTAPDRNTPLELVRRQVEALTVEGPEGPLDAFPAYELLEIALRETQVRQERSIRAVRLAVHAPRDEGQEVVFPVLQTVAQGGERFRSRHRVAKKGGQAKQQARADPEVANHAGAPPTSSPAGR